LIDNLLLLPEGDSKLGEAVTRDSTTTMKRKMDKGTKCCPTHQITQVTDVV